MSCIGFYPVKGSLGHPGTSSFEPGRFLDPGFPQQRAETPRRDPQAKLSEGIQSLTKFLWSSSPFPRRFQGITVEFGLVAPLSGSQGFLKWTARLRCSSWIRCKRSHGARCKIAGIAWIPGGVAGDSGPTRWLDPMPVAFQAFHITKFP